MLTSRPASTKEYASPIQSSWVPLGRSVSLIEGMARESTVASTATRVTASTRTARPAQRCRECGRSMVVLMVFQFS